MVTAREGALDLDFEQDWQVERYDAWSYYRSQFQSFGGGQKGVDFLALEPSGQTLWLVEVKDYRREARDEAKKGSLEQEVADKVRDTLAGLAAATARAMDDERSFSRAALGVERMRVVLHLEQPRSPRRLHFVYDRALVTKRLKSLVRAVDPHPKVVCTDAMNVPWTARATTPEETP